MYWMRESDVHAMDPGVIKRKFRFLLALVLHRSHSRKLNVVAAMTTTTVATRSTVDTWYIDINANRMRRVQTGWKV